MYFWFPVGVHELAGNTILGLGCSGHVGTVIQIVAVSIEKGWLLRLLLFWGGSLRPRGGLDVAGVEELGLGSMLFPAGAIGLMMRSVEGDYRLSSPIVSSTGGACAAGYGFQITEIEPIRAWCTSGGGMGAVNTILSRARARRYVGGQRRAR